MWVQQLNNLGLISMNKLCRCFDKTRAASCTRQLAGMMGSTFPCEETAKFQAYSSIDQSCWNQKLAATETLPIFDDGDNEELEHDVHSFVDTTTHLTSAGC